MAWDDAAVMWDAWGGYGSGGEAREGESVFTFPTTFSTWIARIPPRFCLGARRRAERDDRANISWSSGQRKKRTFVFLHSAPRHWNVNDRMNAIKLARKYPEFSQGEVLSLVQQFK